MILRITLLLLCMVSLQANAQRKDQPVSDIEALIKEEKYTEADLLIKNRTTRFFNDHACDSLPMYARYTGTVATELRGDAAAKKEVIDFIAKAKKACANHEAVLFVYFQSADFLSMVLGDHTTSYNLTQEAKKYFAPHPEVIAQHLYKIESNLGSFAQREGNYGLSAAHYRESLRLIEKANNPDAENVFVAFNSMGIALWQSSKLDSALYFFDKAENYLKTMDSTAVNRYYRVAMINNNKSNIYAELGRIKESISVSEKAIQYYRLFLGSPEPDQRKTGATVFQYQAMDNLAKTYGELGDLSKSHDLLYYSYQQKINTFGENHKEVYKSLLYLGELYQSQREYARAIQFLEKGLTMVRKAIPEPNLWEAYACAQLAYTYDYLGKPAQALPYYEQGRIAFEAESADGYSLEYLALMRHLAAFYAKANEPAKAIEWSHKALDYVVRNQGKESLLAFQQMLSSADIDLLAGRYAEAKLQSEQSIAVADKLMASSKEVLDSIRISMQKPKAILYLVKAEYSLQKDRTEQSLKEMITRLNAATALIDKQKTILTDDKDIGLLLADNSELNDFINQLQLELYEKTKDRGYLEQTINFHEASVYSRIRSRLNKQKALQVAGVPEDVLAKEQSLKNAITQSLQVSKTASANLSVYFTAVSKWNEFQAMLKKSYPKYYALRYGADSSLATDHIRKKIPADLSVVRFLYIQDSLYAYVVNKEKQEWIPLHAAGIEGLITTLVDTKYDPIKVGEASYKLYQLVWQPLEKYITTKRVTIIPDRVLYSLSFDMLSTKPTNNFRDLASNSLLSKYALSYHYSLLALWPDKTIRERGQSIAVFAPAFSDEVKKSYLSALSKDTLHIDRSYLSLLPLPFSIGLAQKTSEQFLGNIFLGNESTLDQFRKHAGDNNIIHIGTHAEYNNQYPEYSRLIFSKSLDQPVADNSLYLYDIYNYHLDADLAVLTACETGRPGFYPGEGMISMAHAFNYAGSESILTGLWKIDEQASAAIIEIFYQKLAEGLSKDEALQEAKLHYLQTAEGRMLSPQYWAGLVIMGDTDPIHIKSKSSKGWYIAGILAVLIAVGGFIYYRRKS